jgi:signal transduction histidine kinase/ligand-binding sensor domain-containing protein
VRTAVLLISSVLVSPIFAQQYFKTWTTKNGLPQDNVVNIAQTPDGHLWVATLDGLARFDGVRFKVFNKSNTPEMPNNRIFSMFVDSGGRLWISYANEQTVVVYENGNFRRFEKGKDYEKDETSPALRLGIERYRNLLHTPEMSFRSGETEYTYEDGRFVARPAPDRDFPAKVFATDDRSVWIDEGDAVYRVVGDEVTRYGKNGPLPIKSNETIPMDFAERDGVIWCAAGATLADISLISFKNGKATTFPGVKGVYDVEFDAKGNLLISTIGRVLKVDADRVALNDASNFPLTVLLEESGSRFYRDRGGNIWFGGSLGLHLLKPDPAVTFYSAASNPPIENVYPIVQDGDGTIWFAAWVGDRLFSYRDGRFDSEYGYILTSLFVDSRARLWKGTGGAVAYREYGSWVPIDYEKNLPPPWNQPAVFTGELSFISEGGDGAMWFGTEGGLIREAGPDSRLFTVADGLPANVVTSYIFTRSGETWVGTNAGIARLEGDGFRAFTEADGLAGNYTRSFYEDPDGTLWIGSYDGGLTRYKNGEFRSITKRDGLFSDGVFVILEDDAGWFWMNSNQGIYRVRRQELNDFADGLLDSITCVSYGPEDGLLEVEGNGGKHPAGLKARDGRLWFPMAKGVAVVDPKLVKREAAPPPVLIDEMRVDGKPATAPVGASLRLEPGQVSLEIDYTALGFVGAERTRFRYRLEDLDDHWTEAGTRRTAYFSHLPPGEHVFRVTAANDSGIWNNEGASVRIVVIPPFYKTWWFFAAAAAGILSIVTLFYFLRLRQLKVIGEARSDFARQLIESQEGERHRIALELHDSIGQTLAVIRNRTLLGLDTEDADRMREQLEQISEASHLALEETREIARNLHPAQIENLGLTAALRSLVASVENATGLACVADIGEVPRTGLPDNAPINIYRIAQESLSNIIKHSGASQAIIRLRHEGGRITLAVEDDGRGFASATAANGLGLAGMRERAQMIGAELAIDTHPGDGAVVRLVLPVTEQ